MWTVCITSIRHVLKLNGYGGPQAKVNGKSQCFKGWETLVISQDDFIARTNVWMDSYRNMPNRFDTTLSSWKAWVTI